MFPYFGELEEFHREISRNRKALKRAYDRVLGGRLFHLVEEADQLYLNEGSFRSQKFADSGGQESPGPTSKFLMAAVTEVPKPTVFHPDGSFESEPVFMGPGFVFSQEGMGKYAQSYGQWMPPALGTYLHEYNHFVFWAIQSVPLYFAICVIADIIRPKRIPPTENDIEEMVAALTCEREEKIARAALAGHLSFLHWTYELHTEWLDIRIFRQLGYEPPRSHLIFPPDQARMVHYHVPSLNLLIPVAVRNSLSSMKPEKCLLRLEQWHRSMSVSHPVQRRFMESLASAKIRRQTLDETIAMQQGRETLLV
ncbi:MAG: hypothetical protein NT039_01795 [Candidatus Berkelbacteria bacterium]|nr:hypothetical protein [Candidatus Berkelbacteria bacterium]